MSLKISVNQMHLKCTNLQHLRMHKSHEYEAQDKAGSLKKNITLLIFFGIPVLT